MKSELRKERQDRLTPERLNKLWYRAYYYAIRHKHGNPVDAEDFASYAVELSLRGRSVTVSLAFIDFLRMQYGYARNPVGRQKMQALLNPVALEDCLEGAEAPEEVTWPELAQHFGLRERKRAIWLLKYQWGLTVMEIGSLFGVTDGYIVQTLSKITDQIKMVLNQERAELKGSSPRA